METVGNNPTPDSGKCERPPIPLSWHPKAHHACCRCAQCSQALTVTDHLAMALNVFLTKVLAEERGA